MMSASCVGCYPAAAAVPVLMAVGISVALLSLAPLGWPAALMSAMVLGTGALLSLQVARRLAQVER